MKHFTVPIAVNALRGTVLWTTYAETFTLLEPRFGHHPTICAAVCGSVAGGSQALVAAPAENVRLLLEGGSVYHGWSHAWKEVFRGTAQRSPSSRKEDIQDMRQVRLWMKEVGEMAGRGWDGVGYGVVKDMCGAYQKSSRQIVNERTFLGFAAFFAIFEMTRRFASSTAEWSSEIIRAKLPASQAEPQSRRISRTVHGVTLVSGGVRAFRPLLYVSKINIAQVFAGLAYEYIGRPFDHVRRLAHLHKVIHSQGSLVPLVFKQFQEDPTAFFRNPFYTADSASSHSKSSGKQRLLVVLRTLGRVGPWGIGFLAWEAFGQGLGD